MSWGSGRRRSGCIRAAAAAGWGGDRYELWQRGGEHVLVLRWRWDTERDLGEFERAARTAIRGKTAALAVTRREATIAFAPDARLARRLLG